MHVSFGPYRLKRQERLVEGPDGPLDLSARAFDLLCVLLDHPGEVVSKDAIFAAVWPGVVVEENTLQVHVSALRKALDPGMIATVHGRGYKYAGPAPEPAGNGNASAKPDAKPVIVVLPFDNLSGDPEQQYFSDGAAEDIIDRLTRFQALAVIGRHSAFALRGPSTSFADVRSRLGAGYAVTGNVRRTGGRIRVAVRLINTVDETAVWAEHYDRPEEDIFGIQDEVAAIVAGQLRQHVEQDVGSRAGGKRNLTSYERVLRGLWHFRSLTMEGHRLGAQCFREALELEPDNVEAMYRLAVCHTSYWMMSRKPDDLQLGLSLGRRAVELAPGHALCQAARAFTQLWAEGVEAASPAIRRAVGLNPGDSYVLADAGLHAIYDGRLAEARSFLDAADRLDPISPRWFREYRGLLDFVEGRYAAAAPGFADLDGCMYDTAYLIASLALAQDHEGLDRIMPSVRARGWDLERIAADEPYRDPEPRQRLIAGLKLAQARSYG